MKRNLITLCFAGLFLFIFNSYPNAKPPSKDAPEVKKDIVKSEGIPAAPGTYQFIVIPSPNGEPFTKDYLIMIENYRDDEKERILALTQTTKVRIPSRAAINDPGFKLLKEIVYTPPSKPTNQTQ